MQLSFPVAQLSTELIDRIRRETVEALWSLPHGGLEVAGVLFGTILNGEVRISAVRPVECEHAGGPALLLSERDERKLDALLSESRYDSELRDLDILGWYVSHTRRPFELTGTDRMAFNRFFPEPMQFTAVIRPETSGAAQFAWFVRGEDGSVNCDRPSYEFTAEPAAQRALVPVNHAPPSHALQSADLEYVPYESLDLERVPALRQVRIGTRSLVFGMLLVILASTAVLLWLRAHQRAAPVAASLALPLKVSNVGTDLRIEWDATAQVVQRATSGAVEIKDSAGKPVRIGLSSAALRNGSVIYNQPSGLMEIHLRLALDDGAVSDSIVYFVAREQAPLKPDAVPLAVAPAAKVDLPAPQESKTRVFTKPPAPTPAPVSPAAALVDPPKLAVPLGPAASQPFVPVHAEAAPPPPASKEITKTAPVPTSGRLIWTGELHRNSVLRVTGSGPSAGALNDRLPGFPVKIGVHSGELLDSAMTIYVPDANATRTAEAPSRRNGWNVTLYKWDPKRLHDLTIVELPSVANGWKGLALKSDTRTIPVIVIDWQQDNSAEQKP